MLGTKTKAFRKKRRNKSLAALAVLTFAFLCRAASLLAISDFSSQNNLDRKLLSFVKRERLVPGNSLISTAGVFIVAIPQAMRNLFPAAISMQPCVLGGVTDVYNLESTIFS
jgi:hypothetical protein